MDINDNRVLTQPILGCKWKITAAMTNTFMSQCISIHGADINMYRAVSTGTTACQLSIVLNLLNILTSGPKKVKVLDAGFIIWLIGMTIRNLNIPRLTYHKNGD